MTSQVDLDLEEALLEGARDRLRSLGPLDLSEALLVIHSLRDGVANAGLLHLLPRLDEIANDLSRGAEGAVERARQAIRRHLDRLGTGADDSGDELEQCFAEEATGHLDRARELVRRLAGHGDDREALQELYRVVHTFKGAAGMVGQRDVARAAHLLEDLLEELFDRARRVEPTVVRRLDQALDLLERFLEHPDQSKELGVALLVLIGGIEPPPSKPEPPRGGRLRRRARPIPRRTESSVSVRFDGSVLHEMRAMSRRSRSTAAELRRGIGAARTELEALTPIADELVELAGRAASSFERRLLVEMARSLLDVVDAVDRQTTSLARGAGRLARSTERLESIISESQQLRASWVFERLEKAAEELGSRTGRPLTILRVGEDVVLGRRLASWVVEPLLHLVRNAVAHGLESPAQRAAVDKDPAGRIALEARSGPGWIAFGVTDDGRGIDLDAIRERVAAMGLRSPSETEAAGESRLLEWMFLPGVSSRTDVDEAAGRGVGLDAVHAEVVRRGGRLEVETWPGRGCRFEILLPGAGESAELIPFRVASTLFALPSDEVKRVDRGEERLGQPARALAEALGIAAEDAGQSVTLQTSIGPLAVDTTLASTPMDVRSLGGRLAGVGPYQGAATSTATGEIALVLDLEALDRCFSSTEGSAKVLVVEDSPTVRAALVRALEEAGHRVDDAADGEGAWERMSSSSPYDLVVTDLEMPRAGGFELIDRARARPAFAETPFVVVTSKSSLEARLRARRLGVAAFLEKEWGHRALVRSVAVVVDAKKEETLQAQDPITGP